MFDKRGSGVLLHISSMPSEYGVGVFGGGIYDFIDKISEMGFSYWQILPIYGIDMYGSPYCAPSAFAGNYIFIDPQSLLNLGLVSEKDVLENIYDGSPYTADYEFAQKTRLKLLKTAYGNITDDISKESENFKEENPWLENYALYMTFKEANKGRAWNEWENGFKDYSSAVKHRSEYKDEENFWCFVQYIFYSQWEKVKKYANKKGIAVIGDMPFYVSFDSADVWADIKLFDIDKKTFRQNSEAGVPPDYFSEDGQLWGNPVYDWNVMKRDNYSWWFSRIAMALKTFDAVRIDHFRAFASYYTVPSGAKTAKDGEWKTGAGKEFFDRLFIQFPDAHIIAEDLGCFGEDVKELLEYTGFPGMNVIQFAFDVNSDSEHLPHNAKKNSVSYVGTHDNNTILGWLWEADDSERQFALEYIGFDDKNWGDGGYQSKSCRKVIETVWRSSSNTAVVSFQDMCGFGSDARMNTPGTTENNWKFRITKENIDSVDKAYFLSINNLFRRRYSPFETI